MRDRADVRSDLRIAVDETMEIIAVENQEVCRLDGRHRRRTALPRQQRHLAEEVPLLEPDFAARRVDVDGPLAIRYIASPGSPLRMMTVPACTVRALRMPTRSESKSHPSAQTTAHARPWQR